jgi:hypothetical protein
MAFTAVMIFSTSEAAEAKPQVNKQHPARVASPETPTKTTKLDGVNAAACAAIKGCDPASDWGPPIPKNDTGSVCAGALYLPRRGDDTAVYAVTMGHCESDAAATPMPSLARPTDK